MLGNKNTCSTTAILKIFVRINNILKMQNVPKPGIEPGTFRSSV